MRGMSAIFNVPGCSWGNGSVRGRSTGGMSSRNTSNLCFLTSLSTGLSWVSEFRRLNWLPLPSDRSMGSLDDDEEDDEDEKRVRGMLMRGSGVDEVLPS
jgi:hypothetical protein